MTNASLLVMQDFIIQNVPFTQLQGPFTFRVGQEVMILVVYVPFLNDQNGEQMEKGCLACVPFIHSQLSVCLRGKLLALIR